MKVPGTMPSRPFYAPRPADTWFEPNLIAGLLAPERDPDQR
jgi:hypothetical protein